MAHPLNGPVIALEPDGIEIPREVADLGSFRAWTRSDDFPERGRIDWIGGRLEVDMSPEDLFTHGTPRSAIAARLVDLIQEPEKGFVFIDRARFVCPEADLSVEPDVLVLLVETLESGKARLLPKASRRAGRFVEIEGSADLVVECVSDCSAAKERRLRCLPSRSRARALACGRPRRGDAARGARAPAPRVQDRSARRGRLLRVAGARAQGATGQAAEGGGALLLSARDTVRPRAAKKK